MQKIILAWRCFQTNKLIDSASSLAITTLFTIIPAITLAFSVFALSAYFAIFQEYVEDFLFVQLLPENYDSAIIYLQQFINSAKQIKGFNILFLFIAVMVLFRNIDKRINFIWSNEKSRHFGKGIVLYITSLILAPLLLGISLFISSYINHNFNTYGLLTLLLPFILTSFGVAILYYTSPLDTPKFKNALKSATTVALFLEIIKFLMLLYIDYFPFYEIIYGSLSILLMFILLVYFGWIIVLFGGCYCYILEQENV